MSRTRKTRPSESCTFVVYYRVSDQKQGRSGLGLDAQRALVESYVARVKGHILSEYTEVETGKRHGKRPQLAAAIAEVKRAKATLLIAKLDRLARNVAFISNLMESAADFVVADMPTANRLTIHMLAAVAEYEGDMISERTRAALAAAKARGTTLGNPNWRVALDKANAAKAKPLPSAELKQIIEAHRTAGLSFRQIAKTLNKAQLKTRTGAVWYPSSVRAALQEGA